MNPQNPLVVGFCGRVVSPLGAGVVPESGATRGADPPTRSGDSPRFSPPTAVSWSDITLERTMGSSLMWANPGVPEADPVADPVATISWDLDRCGCCGCRGRSRTRSLVRSRCAMTRPSNCIRSCQPGTASEPGSRGGRREAYISTQHPPTCQKARVPLTHEHPRRPCRAEKPPRQGPRPTLGLIGRIRERHAFVRLGREGTRIRRSALWCIWCPDPDSTATSIAFAINRACGPAVTRNRLRRRLRSILRELDRSEATPPALLLIGIRPEAIELTFDQLRSEMTAVIEQIRRQCPPVDHSA